MSMDTAFESALPDDIMQWYQDNAEAAAKIMLPGTKGRMLAVEAVPRLIDEIKRLRMLVEVVCSHPRWQHDRCMFCGAPEDAFHVVRGVMP